MDEKRNDKRQKRVIILLLLLIFLLLVFILILLLRKPTVIIQDNQPKTNNTQEVITDDKSKSSDQTKDDTKKEDNKKINKKQTTKEETEETPIFPVIIKKNGKIEVEPTPYGEDDINVITYDGKLHQLIDLGESSTGTMMYYVSESTTVPADNLFIKGTDTDIIERLSKSNAGHYYVWYYSKGDSSHKDTNKAYVEVWIQGSPSSLKVVKAEGLSYQNKELTLITEVDTKVDGKDTGTAMFALGTSNTKAPAREEYSILDPKVINAGTYYVWCFTNGDASHMDTDPQVVEVVVNKAYCYITPSNLADIVVNPELKGNYPYTGGPQSFVKDDVVFKVLSSYTGDTNVGTFKAALSLSDTVEPISSEFKDPKELKTTKVGKYYIWVKADINPTYSMNIESYPPNVEGFLNIVPAVGYVTTPPTGKTGLVIGSNPQTLIDTKSVKATGKLKYYVTEGKKPLNKDSFKSDVPSVTAENTKDFYVWYYVEASTDGNYLESDILGPIIVHIGIERCKVTSVPKALTSITYDGEPKQLLINAGTAQDGKMQFASSKNGVTAPSGDKFKEMSPDQTIVPADQLLPGEYYFWYRAYPNDLNKYDPSDPVCITIVVKKGNAAVPTGIKAASKLGYNDGKDIPLIDNSAAVSTTGTIEYSLDNKTWSKNIPTGNNIGSYTVYYRDPGNDCYNASSVGKLTVNIVKGTINAVPPQSADPQYDDGNLVNLVYPGSVPTGCYIYYGLGTKTNEPFKYEKDVIPTGSKLDATYYVWWYASDGNKQYVDTEHKCIEVTITDAKEPATVIKAPTYSELIEAYNYSSQKLVMPGTASGGTMRYAVTDASVTEAPVRSAKNYPYTSSNSFTVNSYLPQATDAGEYKVWYYVEGDSEHGNTKASLVENKTITIDKIQGEINIGPKGIRGLIYNGNSQTLIDDSNVLASAPLEYQVNSGEWSDTLPEAIAAGKYIITWRTKESKNFSPSNPDGDVVNIGKPFATAIAPTAIPNVVYSGTPVDVATPGDTQGTGVMWYDLSEQGPSEMRQKDKYTSDLSSLKAGKAGIWYLYYEVRTEETGEYAPVREQYIVITVYSGKASITQAPTAIEGLQYTGSSQVLVNEGYSSSGIVMYALTTEDVQPSLDKFSMSLPEATDVDDYYVWYYAGENSDVAASDIEKLQVSISKVIAKFNIAPKANVPIQYDGNNHALIKSDTATSIDGTPYFYVTKDDNKKPSKDEITVTDINKITGNTAGTYHIWTYIKGDNDHSDSPVQHVLDVTIDKAIASVDKTNQILANSLTYDGGPKTLVETPPVGAGGTMMYYVSPIDMSGDLLTDDEEYSYAKVETGDPLKKLFKETIDTPTNPGTYYIYGFCKGDENHYDSLVSFIGNVTIESGFLEFTVTPPKGRYVTNSSGDISDSVFANVEGPGDNVQCGSVTEGYHLKYAVTSTPDKPSLNEFYTFDEGKDTVLRRSQFGKYYVWYYPTKDGGDGFTPECEPAYVISVFKGEPTVLIPPQGLASIYEGVPVASITPGVVEGGTMVYCLVDVTSGESTKGREDNLGFYTEEIPTISKPGEYEVWCYIYGDENHVNSSTKWCCATLEVHSKSKILEHPTLVKDVFPLTKNDFNLLASNGKADDNSTIYYKVKSAKESEINNINDINKTNDKIFEDISLKQSDYVLYYVAKPKSYSKYCEASDIYKLYFTVGKMEGYVNKEPKALENLKAYPYSEYESVQLIEPGECDYDNISYAITTEKGVMPPDSAYQDYYGSDESMISVYNPGTYYVWYKVSGRDEYYDYGPYLVKEDGIVVAPCSGEPVVTAPKAAKGLVYDGKAYKALTSPASTSKGTIQYYLTPANNVTYINFTNEAVTSIPTITEPGDYRVYYRSYGNSISEMSHESYVDVTMEKVTPTIVAPVIDSNLVADGHLKPLIKKQPTCLEYLSAEFEYAIKSNGNDIPDEDDWVSYDAISRKEGGKYFVWYRSVENKYYKASEPKCVVIIMKMQKDVETAPIAASAEYTGEAITPLTSGYSSWGTIKYAKTQVKQTCPSLSTFTSTIPTVIEPGEYYYWWYCESNDGLYLNSDPKEISINVNKKTIGFESAPIINNLLEDGYSLCKQDNTSDYSLKALPTLNVSSDKATIKYAILSAIEAKSAASEDDYPWSDTPDFSKVTDFVAEGDYVIYYKAETKDPEHYASSYTNNVNFNLVKGFNGYVNEPQSVNETYDGTPKSLIAKEPEPKAKNGMIYYAVCDSKPEAYIDNGEGGTMINPVYSSSVPTRTMPGTYTIWYFAEETTDYQASKPVSITSTISGTCDNVAPTVSANTTTNIYNDGAAVDLVTLSSEGVTNGTMYYIIESYPSKSLVPATTYDDERWKTESTQTAVGTYIVYYYYEFEDTTKTDINYLISEIRLKECTFNMVLNAPRSVGHLSFESGVAQNVSGAPMVENNDYTIHYYVLESADKEAPTNKEGFETTVPKRIEPGTYRVYWYASCDDGTCEDTDINVFTSYIDKDTGSIKEDPKQNVNSKNGSLYVYDQPVKLIDPGSLGKGHEDTPLFYYLSDKALATFDKEQFTDIYDSIQVSKPGYYYVYYFAKENAHYTDSPIKCMKVYVESFYLPATFAEANDLEYNNDYQQLVNSDKAKIEDETAAKEAGLEPTFVYALGTADSCPDESQFTAEIPTAKEVGTYYVYSFVSYQKDKVFRISDIAKIPVAITKANKEFKINEDYLNKNLTETGYDLSIFNKNPNDEWGRKIMYCLLTEEESKYVSINDSLFSEAIPTVKEAGRYCLCYYAAESKNVYRSSDAYNENYRLFFTVEPAGIEPSPTIRLTYNGTAQELIMAGDNPYGTYFYALSKDGSAPSNSEYSRVIPTAIDAADGNLTLKEPYVVYYKLVYNDGTQSNPKKIETYILQKQSTMKREAVGYEDEPLPYTGQSQSLLKTTALPTSEDDGQIYYIVYDHEPDVETMLMDENDPTYVLEHIYTSASYDKKLGTIPVASEAGKYYIVTAVIPDYLFNLYSSLINIMISGGDIRGIEDLIPADANTNYTCLDISGVGTSFMQGSYSITSTEIKKNEVKIIKEPKPIGNLQYDNNNPIVLVTDGEVENGDIYYAVSKNAIEPDKSAFITDLPTACNVGEYFVWWYAKGDELHSDSKINSFQVKIEGEGPTISAPEVYNDLIYTGSELDLISKACESLSGTPMYKLTNEAKAPAIGAYSSELPKASEVGTYYIWFYSDSLEGMDTIPDYVTVNIEKGFPTITKYPKYSKYDDLASLYGRDDVALITPGEAQNGEFYYCTVGLTGDPDIDNVTPSLSKFTKDDYYYSVGKYRVWYYVKSTDKQHYQDIEPRQINGTVEVYYVDEIEGPHLSTAPLAIYGLESNGSELHLTDGGDPARGWEFRYYVVNAKEKTNPEQPEEEFIKEKFYDYNNHKDSYNANSDIAIEAGDYYVGYALVNTTNEEETYFFGNDESTCVLKVHVDLGKAQWRTYPRPATNAAVESATKTNVVLLQKESAVPLSDQVQVQFIVKKGKVEKDIPSAGDFDSPTSINICEINAKERGTGWFTVFSRIKGDDVRFSDSDIHVCTVYVKPLEDTLTDATFNNNLTYGESPLYLLEDSNKAKTLNGDPNGKNVMYYVSQFNTQPLTSSNGWKPSNSVMVSAPGTYYVWYYGTEYDVYGQTEMKCSGPIVVSNGGQHASISVTEPNTNIVYDGTEYSIFGDTNAIFTNGLFTTNLSEGSVTYYLTKNINEIPGEKAVQIEAKDLEKVSQAGTYNLWYYAHDGKEQTSLNHITFEIKKAKVSYDKPYAYSDLVYAGVPIEMMDYYGNVENDAGTIKFAVTETNNEPLKSQFRAFVAGEYAVNAYKPGTYYVWYYVDVNPNYEEESIKCLPPITVEEGYYETQNPVLPESKSIKAGSLSNPVTVVKPGYGYYGEEFYYYFNGQVDVCPAQPTYNEYTNDSTGLMCQFSTEGTYYVWYFIQYPNGARSNPALIESYACSANNYPELTKDPKLINNGYNIGLAQNGSICPIEEEAVAGENCYPEYAIVKNIGDAASFTDDIYSDLIKVSEYGHYYLAYRAVNSNSFNHSETKYIEFTVIVVEDISLFFSKGQVPRLKTNPLELVVLDGKPIDILESPGLAARGTSVYYYFGKNVKEVPDKSKFKASLTSATVSEPGTYYLYYYAVHPKHGSSKIYSVSANVIGESTFDYIETLPECPLQAAQGKSILSVVGTGANGYSIYYCVYPNEEFPTDMSLFDTAVPNAGKLGKQYVHYFASNDNKTTQHCRGTLSTYVVEKIESDEFFKYLPIPETNAAIKDKSGIATLLANLGEANDGYELLFCYADQKTYDEGFAPTIDDYFSVTSVSDSRICASTAGTHYVWYIAKQINGDKTSSSQLFKIDVQNMILLPSLDSK